METAPLKSFATWARKELIREVTARIAVVLAPASAERVEQPRSVEALEKAVAAAGGGDKGKAAVADKVAYTWFNRIIALRFMDANGYTSVGVVSPQAGVETGQPEVLAEAKRGNIDTGVIASKTRETVTSLLNGTRQSDDAQGEAYALLLADYCRHWNRAMPFMFEREGDFTELLIPGNLLADDSVSSRAVKVLTKDVCQDVEVIGWLYQFYISERKDEVFAAFKKNKKAGADEIPAATQLFTPHWIVRYLVENSLGRLWILNRPTSHLVDQMQYYIAPVDEETEFLKIGRPEELKVVDPACGSGHMLTYAFDLLYAIYEEEGYAPSEIPGLILANNLYGVEIDPRAGALAAFALTMKARAKQRTFFNKQVGPNVCVLDPISFTAAEIDFLLTRGGDKHAEAVFWNQFEHAETFGALIRPDPELTVRLKHHIAQLDDGGDILSADVLDWAERVIEQAEYLSSEYAVVVANPPYMGSKNMGGILAEFGKVRYAETKADLFSMFVERIVELGAPRARLGIMSPNVWLTLPTYRSLRKRVKRQSIRTLVELPLSGFSDAVVQICAYVLAKQPWGPGRATMVDLTGRRGPASGFAGMFLEAVGKDQCEDVHYRSLVDFDGLPLDGIYYALPEWQLNALRQPRTLSSVGIAAVGIQSSDTGRFTRQWYEVSRVRIGFNMQSREQARESRKRWFPLNSGGDFRRWYGNQELVMNWENDGQEIRNFKDSSGRLRSRPQNLDCMFRSAVSWSAIGSGTPAFRFFPAGHLFDNAGISFFPTSEEDLANVLAYVNSSPAVALLKSISPTLNLNAGQMESLPFPKSSSKPVSDVWELVEIFRQDWDSQETSSGFSAPWWYERTGELSRLISDSHGRDAATIERAELLEDELGVIAAAQLGAEGFVAPPGPASLHRNPVFRFGSEADPRRRSQLMTGEDVRDLVSYAVGCMFGRYSLDAPGLILADQGASAHDYLAKVPSPTFAPDKDNVIPVVDGDWFEDDIVARFRTFLRLAFGEQHFEENLRFVTESLGVRDIREYFVKAFYKDHVQRYKKRPIYWLFSSPKGSFNALIYMHRYSPSTVSTVLNEYLREFTAKLTSSLQQQERLAAGGGTPRQQAAAQKESDRLRKVLLELEEYEHDVLYPLASRQLAIDLDDGVKANYPKFGAALKKIPGLEATDE